MVLLVPASPGQWAEPTQVYLNLVLLLGVVSGVHRSSILPALSRGWAWETGRQDPCRGWGPQSYRKQWDPIPAGREWGSKEEIEAGGHWRAPCC